MIADQAKMQLKVETEKRAEEWLIEFCTEVDDIESFYISKFNELVNKFIDMQAKFLVKLQVDQKQHEKKDNKKSTHDLEAEKVVVENLEEDNEAAKLYVSPIDGKIIKVDKRDHFDDVQSDYSSLAH